MAQGTPLYQENHYMERRSEPASSGTWAVVAVIIALLALVLFASGAFRANRGSNTGTNGTNINGSVNTPSGTYEGSGTISQ